MIAPLLLAAAATAATNSGAPGPAALPRYEPGDAFVFSDGRVEQFVRAKGESLTWRGLTGSSYQRSRNFIVPVIAWRNKSGSGTRTVHGNADALWPITKPRSARFRVVTETQAKAQSAPKRSVSLWVCKTSKAQQYTVTAGTFTAIPVVCDRYSTTTMRLVERREWDYAPELGHYIRRVSINYLRGSNREIELVAALSGPAANKSRLASLARAARAESVTRSGRRK